MTSFRTGFGFDVHQLVAGRPLVIGGVTIPNSKGALGHSDADVLLHAISDAFLGAAALGDIGTHFPDSDPSLKNIESSFLLKKVIKKLKTKGFEVVNVDSTIVLQSPKLQSHIAVMRQHIAEVTGVGVNEISVKATTTEYMGFIGKEDGIAAFATVMIRK